MAHANFAASLAANAVILVDNLCHMPFCPLVIFKTFQTQAFLGTQLYAPPASQTYRFINFFNILRNPRGSAKCFINYSFTQGSSILPFRGPCYPELIPQASQPGTLPSFFFSQGGSFLDCSKLLILASSSSIFVPSATFNG